MRKVLFLILMTLTLSSKLFPAIIGGEIKVENINGTEIKVSITVCHTFNNIGDSIGVDFGDGTTSIIARIDLISNSSYYKSVYQGFHTYASNGVYVVSTDFINWPYGIVNIPNSLGAPFGLSSIVKVNNLNNLSPVFQNTLLTDTAIVGLVYIYNPLAYDPDGDSIAYRLIDCIGENSNPISGYFVPTDLTLDSLTGDITWNLPPGEGMWAIAYLIEEWRNSNELISKTMRQMIITVTNQSAIGQTDINNKINIFPNPTTGSIYIGVDNVKKVMVYNTLGKCVTSLESVNEINFKGFEKGIYFIRIFTDNNMMEEKIILE